VALLRKESDGAHSFIIFQFVLLLKLLFSINISIELLNFCKGDLQKWYKNVVYIKMEMVIISIIKGGGL
jgi:hypothetical protein